MKNARAMKVGDTVWIHDVNQRGGSRQATVARVGRKFFYVGRDAFHIRGGKINDAYGHKTAYTTTEHEAREAMFSACHALATYGIRLEAFRTKDAVSIYAVLRSLIEATPKRGG